MGASGSKCLGDTASQPGPSRREEGGGPSGLAGSALGLLTPVVHLPQRELLSLRHIQDPASQRLTWNKSPKSVLVIKKIRDASLLQPFKELCVYLMEVRGGLDPSSRQQDPPGVGGTGPGV